MSTLRANTLSDASGSNSVPMATVASGTAKAWVNFNGTGTVAIRAAFNVTSITDNGVGNYRINFTNPMPDANFTLTGTYKMSDDSSVADSDGNVPPFSFSTSGVSVFTVHGGGAPIDCAIICAAIFR